MFRTIFALALSGAIGFTGMLLAGPGPAVAQVAGSVQVGPVSGVVDVRDHRGPRSGQRWRGQGPRYGGQRWRNQGPRYSQRHHYRPHRHHRPHRPIVRYHRPNIYYHAPVVPHVYRRPAPRALHHSHAHYEWCYARYRSYRAVDNTFQPYRGPRRQCRSPYA